jgi:hypothetical protein
LRFIIYLIPVASVVIGLYLILFPIESFNYYSDKPSLSKFEFMKNIDANEIRFGVFPLRNHRFINLKINSAQTEKDSCRKNPPSVYLERTYQAFLYPDGGTVNSKEELKDLLFADNNTEYPNGSLLHLKPTDEVFFISHGKRILFPGPEIFFSFGFNFDNLNEVDQSTIDQFPEADDKVFLWTNPHPDGTIFQGFPSHSLYLALNGRKYLIPSPEILKDLWPNYYTIPVDDISPENKTECRPSEKDYAQGAVACSFDTNNLPLSIGKYYLFTVKYPDSCPVSDIHPENARINFIAERSYATIKDTIRTIFASVLNRYIQQQ